MHSIVKKCIKLNLSFKQSNLTNIFTFFMKSNKQLSSLSKKCNNSQQNRKKENKMRYQTDPKKHIPASVCATLDFQTVACTSDKQCMHSSTQQPIPLHRLGFFELYQIYMFIKNPRAAYKL